MLRMTTFSALEISLNNDNMTAPPELTSASNGARNTCNLRCAISMRLVQEPIGLGRQAGRPAASG